MQKRPYEPSSSELQDVQRRISDTSWAQRVEDARRRQQLVEKILRLIEQGKSQNQAILATVNSSKRSAMLRDLTAYRTSGFEGLIDRRTPRGSELTPSLRDTIEVARMANPSLTVEAMEAILETKFHTKLSSATIKRVWNHAGLQRPTGRPHSTCNDNVAPDETTRPSVEHLEAAGMQLVLGAAEAETGAIEQLVDTVMQVAKTLPKPSPASAKERALRNAKGQLTAEYNRARRKRDGQLIATTHRTAEEKAQERDLGRLSFRAQSRQTIERKVQALVCLPIVTPTRGRIEDLRGPRGQLLGELCGYDYQTETIRKLVSEFTLAGLGPALQQTHARTWHDVSVRFWETDYRASIVYVDNNVKPLWTRLFTKSTKVSSTGRVQPALTSTFIHTGAGVPIHFETHSGAAPLAPRVLQLIESVEERAEHPLGRLTVIDGECCSAGLLDAFKGAGRDLIVPLPATMIKPERFQFGRGSGFRPYRDGDRIREGMITLQDSKDRDVRVDARAIIIERRTKETWSVLVSLAGAGDWSTRGLADAYFGRWPNQEGFFREANQALGLRRVHGYGKRVVTNTVVLTKLEQATARLERTDAVQAEEVEALEEVERAIATLHGQTRKIADYRAKREERVDAALEQGRTENKRCAAAVAELRSAADEERSLRGQLESLEQQRDRLEPRIDKRRAQIDKWQRQRDKQATRTEIVEADVAQDTLFTAMKLTLGMLVQFVAREYFKHRPIEWATFLARIATLPGRRETTADIIAVYIYGNRRDIKLMRNLDKACRNINKRDLEMGGRRLRYAVDWPDGAPDGWLE